MNQNDTAAGAAGRDKAVTQRLADAENGVRNALDGVAFARDALTDLTFRNLKDQDLAETGAGADAVSKLLHLADGLRDVARIIENRQLRGQLAHPGGQAP